MSLRDLDNTCRDVLIDLYDGSRLTVDTLPYTEEFERLRAEFNRRTSKSLSNHDFWIALSSLRKAGLLRRKER